MLKTIMKRISIIIIPLLLLGTALTIAVAQTESEEEILLEYGDVVEAVMPMNNPEVLFRFEGNAEDIVVVEVVPDDILSALLPEIEILNSRYSTLIDTESLVSIDENYNPLQATAVFEVPADGEYVILVKNGPFGDLQMDADFAIRLLEPVILTPGQEVADSVTNLAPTFYVVISNQPFTLEYSYQDGAFHPGMYVARVADGARETLAGLYGEGLAGGLVIVEPVGRSSVHMVTIQRSPLDIDIFSEKTANFTLTLLD